MDFATWTDSDLRAVCRRNDPNGDFDDCTRADLVAILTGWMEAGYGFIFHPARDRAGRCGEDRTMATSYVVRWNLPGCMPDCDPAEFDTLDEARRYLIGELRRNEDSAESEDDAEEWCALAEEANLIGVSGGICVGPDGYVYVLSQGGL